ncbi:tryptophan-rich sensory protein [Streptomyces flavotricini]|uniref:Tryptophan-rich sensory protein n=1 Tax=Streptomyces flavotricini TaxID=66888 RepID=A0ABS8EH74_9ACTN|nr:TspO/MBR family protein [Streptomyces flavotricini]MCC0100441.1 tryptophan-rich sensory protein [Streptomyces flavotricini]
MPSVSLVGERDEAHQKRRRWRYYAAASAAVTATAALGSVAVDPASSWYRSLDKPAWQPPPQAFGVVWTPLYISLAVAGGRALGAAQGKDRVRVAASLGTNLALNAAWTWLFFGCRSPRAGLFGTLLLDFSNAELIHRTWRVDRTAAKMLAPYALWCAFATGLNGSLAARNR